MRTVARHGLGRFVVAVCVTFATSAGADGLWGSRASLDRQQAVAKEHDFTFLRTPADVRSFIARGYLVRVHTSRHLRMGTVSFPYARPEVSLFLERLSEQYHSGCGEPLVVTSLTRPTTRQPRNASPLSVHPTGMAVDLRMSGKRSCRAWLERVLNSLEDTGVLEATRERRPPHYHVALFPRQYTEYVRGLEQPTIQVASAATEPAGGDDARATLAERAVEVVSTSMRAAPAFAEHQVRRGDSLWDIARTYQTTVVEIRDVNDLGRSRIHPGQVLKIPAAADEGLTTDFVAYRVRRGDSLWDIAQNHGTTVSELRRWNGLTRNRLYPGQVLKIPVAALASSH